MKTHGVHNSNGAQSLTQRINCVGAESGCLSMLRECLVYFSMRLGVPFIAPRQLGAVGDQLERQFLPSVEWCTRQSGAPPDSHCSCLVRDLLPYQAHPTVSPWGCLAHRTQFGAPSRPLERATCRALITRTTVGASSVASPDSPVHHRTVRWILATSPFSFLETTSSSRITHRTVRCTTGQSGDL
jgi:hypothetical protein